MNTDVCVGDRESQETETIQGHKNTSKKLKYHQRNIVSRKQEQDARRRDNPRARKNSWKLQIV